MTVSKVIADPKRVRRLVAFVKPRRSDHVLDVGTGMLASADEAVQRIVQAGGSVLAEPFDIQIGRCAVVQDPWGNRLVLPDMSKGALVTDAGANVVGNAATTRLMEE